MILFSIFDDRFSGKIISSGIVRNFRLAEIADGSVWIREQKPSSTTQYSRIWLSWIEFSSDTTMSTTWHHVTVNVVYSVSSSILCITSYICVYSMSLVFGNNRVCWAERDPLFSTRVLERSRSRRDRISRYESRTLRKQGAWTPRSWLPEVATIV